MSLRGLREMRLNKPEVSCKALSQAAELLMRGATRSRVTVMCDKAKVPPQAFALQDAPVLSTCGTVSVSLPRPFSLSSSCCAGVTAACRVGRPRWVVPILQMSKLRATLRTAG